MKMINLALLFLVLALWMGSFLMLITKLDNTPAESWLVQAGISEMSAGEQLKWTTLKALYMMVGGEEMLPSGASSNCDARTPWCSVESWITLVCLFLGAIIYAFFISTMSSIVLRMDMAGRMYDDKIAAMNQYMRVKQL